MENVFERQLGYSHGQRRTNACRPIDGSSPVKALPAEPADIARAVAFLAGPSAAYITGETLHVNGGMYMP